MWRGPVRGGARDLRADRVGQDRGRRAGRRPARREVVSADSMQVYRGVPILTNQPARATRSSRSGRSRHEASVGEYAELAHARRGRARSRPDRTPVVVGGTGLYLRAALGDLDVPPAPPPGARERWEKTLRSPRARRPSTPLLEERDRSQLRASIRTTGGASSGRSS